MQGTFFIIAYFVDLCERNSRKLTAVLFDFVLFCWLKIENESKSKSG